MNRLYCISYLGRVESKWCNTVKHNNNPTEAITSVLLPAFLHNDFPGKTHFLSHRDFISLALLYEHKQLFSSEAKVYGHIKYTHNYPRTNTCTPTHTHSHMHTQVHPLSHLHWGDGVESWSSCVLFISAFWSMTFSRVEFEFVTIQWTRNHSELHYILSSNFFPCTQSTMKYSTAIRMHANMKANLYISRNQRHPLLVVLMLRICTGPVG